MRETTVASVSSGFAEGSSSMISAALVLTGLLNRGCPRDWPLPLPLPAGRERHSRAKWPAWPQQKHSLFAMRLSLSSLESFLAWRTWTLASARLMLGSFMVVLHIRGPLDWNVEELPWLGCAHRRYCWSKALALLTNPESVVGKGVTPESWLFKPWGRACRKAYIFVASLAPEREA